MDIRLPEGIEPEMAPLFSPSGLVYRYVLESPDRGPRELKTIEDWIVERAYKSVPGVADDSGLGGTVMQYVGDAVMAVFGAPDPHPDHAAGAVRAAVSMHARWRFRARCSHRLAKLKRAVP